MSHLLDSLIDFGENIGNGIFDLSEVVMKPVAGLRLHGGGVIENVIEINPISLLLPTNGLRAFKERKSMYIDVRSDGTMYSVPWF